jgi:hypothetical protein
MHTGTQQTPRLNMNLVMETDVAFGNQISEATLRRSRRRSSRRRRRAAAAFRKDSKRKCNFNYGKKTQKYLCPYYKRATLCSERVLVLVLLSVCYHVKSVGSQECTAEWIGSSPDISGVYVVSGVFFF